MKLFFVSLGREYVRSTVMSGVSNNSITTPYPTAVKHNTWRRGAQYLTGRGKEDTGNKSEEEHAVMAAVGRAAGVTSSM